MTDTNTPTLTKSGNRYGDALLLTLVCVALVGLASQAPGFFGAAGTVCKVAAAVLAGVRLTGDRSDTQKDRFALVAASAGIVAACYALGVLLSSQPGH